MPSVESFLLAEHSIPLGLLRVLEAQGEVALLGRLFQQQIVEHEALISSHELAQRGQWLAKHEILALSGVFIEF